MMNLCDFHIHSNNSFDAENTVDEICRSAIDKGLFAVAITDHCEAPMIKDGENCEFGCFDKLIPSSVNDALKAREKYADTLSVFCGIELGEPMHDPESTSKALGYGDFDFVLASVHNLRNFRDFYYLDYSKTDYNEILKCYFDELAETAEFPFFDSLAHLTYPLRYISQSIGFIPSLNPFRHRIDDIFKILISNNKSLEINVSGLFKNLNSTLPDLELLKRYKELGGELITIGTDAHSSDMVGKGISEGIETARKAGFDRYVYYEAHTPVFVPFDLDE